MVRQPGAQELRAARQRHLLQRLLRRAGHDECGRALRRFRSRLRGRRRRGLLGDGGKACGNGCDRSERLDGCAYVRREVLRLTCLRIAGSGQRDGDEGSAGVLQLRPARGSLRDDAVRGEAVDGAGHLPGETAVLERSLGEDECLAGHVGDDDGRGAHRSLLLGRRSGEPLRRAVRQRRAGEQENGRKQGKAWQMSG